MGLDISAFDGLISGHWEGIVGGVIHRWAFEESGRGRRRFPDSCVETMTFIRVAWRHLTVGT